jgi:hypothetical protein
MKRFAVLFASAALLVLGVAIPTASAATGPSNGNNCQGHDVSNFNASSPPGTLGSIVPGFAQGGPTNGAPLVGFVRGAANCGNN